MPVDDPASHRYMQRVDGMKGWKHWDDNGVRANLENPKWRVQLAEYAEMTDANAVRLDIDSAVQLAYVHSPLHQTTLETLYLTSLDVTGERFRLDTQFFGGSGLAYNQQGTVTPATIAYDPVLNQYDVVGPFSVPGSNRLTAKTVDLQAKRRTATAGEVLVGFANSFAFEFTGGEVSLGSSIANFSFVQPLLRGAGRHVALEQLTLSERRLLANLRAYSQFRQGLFTQIVIGELGVAGPQRAGLNTSLQSFSGIGGVNGYLGLLQQAQQIRYTEDNLRLQLRTLDRLEALYDNELIDIVQVDQFRQNIEVTRATLLDQTNSLQFAIDNYKTQILGLPSDLPIDLDEELVQQFQLFPIESTSLLESLLELQNRIGEIGELSDLAARVELLDEQLATLPKQDFADVDRTLRRLQALVEATGKRVRNLERMQDVEPGEVSQQLSDAGERLENVIDALTEESFEETIAEDSKGFAELLLLCRGVLEQSKAQDSSSEPEQVLDDAEQLVAPVRELFSSARSDLQRLEEVAPQRERNMNADEKARFKRERTRLEDRLDELETGETGFDVAVKDLGQLRDSYTENSGVQTVRGLTAWIQSYLQLVERLSLIPAQARLEVVAVEEVEMEPEAAFQIALSNRLDFMNGRAALVDRWRAIQIAANALQSDLSITGSGDVRTAKNNPVDFRAATSRLQLGVEFDAPLARLLERNGYRESLIQYQQNRRNLIQSQDSLQKGLRSLLRTLKQRRLQLEIQRRAVTIALRRVDQTQLSLLTPPPQGQPGARPQINPTTAINLLSAQGSLQTSQNSFLAAWLDYYAARLRLYRELGVMQLDPSGRWIENSGGFGVSSDSDSMDSLPPPVPQEAMDVDFQEQMNELETGPNAVPDLEIGRPAVVIQPVENDRWNTDLGGRPVVQMAENLQETAIIR